MARSLGLLVTVGGLRGYFTVPTLPLHAGYVPSLLGHGDTMDTETFEQGCNASFPFLPPTPTLQNASLTIHMTK